MPSLAQLTMNVDQPPVAASQALYAVLQESGYEVDPEFVPGAAQYLFSAKRTVLFVERQGGAQITPHGSGSTIEVGIDVHPDKPTGLMDGKHNRSLIADLEEKLTAALGSV